jgi:hypothetical protein
MASRVKVDLSAGAHWLIDALASRFQQRRPTVGATADAAAGW